jgi:hypothetical protein
VLGGDDITSAIKKLAASARLDTNLRAMLDCARNTSIAIR